MREYLTRAAAWISQGVNCLLLGGHHDQTVSARAWPIGSIYVNATNATNPAVLLGFGTWNAIGQGRVLVGVGTGIDANAASRSFAAGAFTVWAELRS